MDTRRAVCLNCMDGRVQVPVIEWITQNHPVEHVDMITEAGMDGALADTSSDIQDILRKVNVSLEKNNAAMLFVVGHYDCKGNPVDESTHKEHIALAVDRMKKEFSQIPVIGFWINEQWQGERV